jgi:DNA-directed RNA polymerase subunit M/transcription elongation factor TFIIS
MTEHAPEVECPRCGGYKATEVTHTKLGEGLGTLVWYECPACAEFWSIEYEVWQPTPPQRGEGE